jgi:parallel beta-helix repeat protein
VYAAAADYTEQLTVPAAKTGLKIVGAEAGVVLKSPADVAKATVAGADLGGALIDVRATKVEVRNLTLNGSTNTDGELYSGIRVVEGGSATISNNTITGLRTAADPNFGLGVQVGSSRGTGTAGTAKIRNNAITDYLGAGVLVDGNCASADVRHNTITGRGAGNGGVAQYGVQVSRGATGRIESNTISGNTAAGNSAGILFFETGGRKNVAARNTVTGNEVGIWLFNTDGTATGRAEVLNNDVTFNGFSGILVDGSNDITVKNNCVRNNTGDGIGVYDSKDTVIFNNKVHNNGLDGIYVFGGQADPVSPCGGSRGGFLGTTNNSIKHNEVYSNGLNGLHLDSSSDNLAWHNQTWGNASNGVYVHGGTRNDIWLSTSATNTLDGILLQDTTYTTVIGNCLSTNGGYGLRLLNADNTFIALNLIENNSSGSIFISADSENVTTVANRTDDPITLEAVGAAATTDSVLYSVADADAAVVTLVD